MIYDIQLSTHLRVYSATRARCQPALRPMEVLFENEKLQRQVSNQRDLRRMWGDEGAKRITLRLQQLAAAETLSDMRQLPGRCHELSGNRAGELAVDVHGGHRLILKPSENPPPTKQEGGLDWSRVESVTVTEIVDYH